MALFYFLKDIRKIGKIDGEVYYLYDKDKGWVQDKEQEIIDRLIGFDKNKMESLESSIGNISILNQIAEITPEEVIELLTKSDEDKKY